MSFQPQKPTTPGQCVLLTKSLFMAGLDCPLKLYLHRHYPELATDSCSESEHTLEQGREVGRFAQGLFPGGIEVAADYASPFVQVVNTKDALRKHNVIYEGAFHHQGRFVKVDILRLGSTGWELYEVKSSTSVKAHHEIDLAYQYYVVTASGLPVVKAGVITLNNDFVKNGDINPHELFTIHDRTDYVRGQAVFMADESEKMLERLHSEPPSCEIGKQCNKPYECAFKTQCWIDIPTPSVFALKGNGANPYQLYNEGIVSFDDIPEGILNKKQEQQVEAWQSKNNYVDLANLEEFMQELWYPLYFLDFEAFQCAIPFIDGTKPYEQIAFQYSLHSIDKEGAEVKHSEYLAKPMTDPRLEMVELMVENIPEDACIVTFNRSFEASVVKRLAKAFPTYADKLLQMVDNMRDLMVPFRNRTVYFWQFMGSYSIKSVLPVLAPELSYANMEVNNGYAAIDAYFNMCREWEPAKRRRIRENLLKYCELDTYAMVRIFEVLNEIVESKAEQGVEQGIVLTY